MKIDFDNNIFEIDGVKEPFYTKECMTFPPKSSKVFYVRIKNIEIKEGFLPPLSPIPEIIVEQGKLKNENGKVYVFITNTLDYAIDIPVMELSPEPYFR